MKRSLFVVLQMTHVDEIAEKLVCSTDDHTRVYGCMVVMALLHRQPDACISVLLRYVWLLQVFALFVVSGISVLPEGALES